MKLTIVTPTARAHPALDEMGAAIAGALARAKDWSEVSWIVVDERLWYGQSPEDLRDPPVPTSRIPPKATPWRGPDKEIDYFAPNSARNTGLMGAPPDTDYVLYIEDCTLIAKDVLQFVAYHAERGNGVRVKCARMSWPQGQRGAPIEDMSGLRLPATTVNGNCFGAPYKALIQCCGFDEEFDGARKWNDIECFVRLERLGVHFFGHPNASAHILADAHKKIPSPLPESRSYALWNELAEEPERVRAKVSPLRGEVEPTQVKGILANRDVTVWGAPPMTE